MRPVFGTLLVLLLCSCSSSDKPCEPGRQLECTCAGGAAGFQICKEDGSGWGKCECQRDKEGNRKASLLNDLAVSLMINSKFDAALEKLDQAIEADPSHVQANYHRGICLAEKRRWKDAIEAFDKTTTLEPKEANAYFNKGKILWNEKRWEEALRALEKAIEHATNLEEPNRASVWILKAESLYELYLDKFHENPEGAGSPSEAIAAFKTYLKERPGSPDKTAVQQKIDILNNPDNYKEELDRRQQLKKTEIDDKRKGPIKREELRKEIEKEEKKFQGKR